MESALAILIFVYAGILIFTACYQVDEGASFPGAVLYGILWPVFFLACGIRQLYVHITTGEWK